MDDARIDGNVGVRVIRTENSADGYLVYPNNAFAPYLGTGQSEPDFGEEFVYRRVAELNVKWELADNLLLRFAASKAIARPAFSDMQAYQQLSVAVRDGFTPDPGETLQPEDLVLTGSSTDNPYLTPMKANQFDLSLEWYFDPDKGGMAWVNFFYKDIKDYFRQQSELVQYPGVDGNQYPYLVSRLVNIGTAKIQGAEIGWNQFFDFLPAPFDGFGMSANYTYIDSSTKIPSASNAVPIDTDGSPFSNLPADGLSKNSYNIAAFYEKGPWQIRVAYNWRSEYLLSVGPNGYNGSYTIPEVPATPTAPAVPARTVNWKLPVYSDAFGQLDASIFYRFSDNVQIGLEMNNLNNAEQRTLMDQNGAGKRTSPPGTSTTAATPRLFASRSKGDTGRGGVASPSTGVHRPTREMRRFGTALSNWFPSACPRHGAPALPLHWRIRAQASPDSHVFGFAAGFHLYGQRADYRLPLEQRRHRRRWVRHRACVPSHVKRAWPMRVPTWAVPTAGMSRQIAGSR